MGVTISKFRNKSDMLPSARQNANSSADNIVTAPNPTAPVSERGACEIDTNDHKSNNNTVEKGCDARPVLVNSSRMHNLNSHIPDTPRGDDVNKFPYYCPLCMEYYKDVLRTQCCGNYVCAPCGVTFVESRGIEVGSVNDLLLIHNNELMQSLLSCPHCGSSTFKPVLVELADSNIRDYSDGVGNQAGRLGVEGNRSVNAFSPVKIGDSFEDLKRKMIYHPVNKVTPIKGEDRDIQEAAATPLLAVVHASASKASPSFHIHNNSILQQHSPDCVIDLSDNFVMSGVELFKSTGVDDRNPAIKLNDDISIKNREKYNQAEAYVKKLLHNAMAKSPSISPTSHAQRSATKIHPTTVPSMKHISSSAAHGYVDGIVMQILNNKHSKVYCLEENISAYTNYEMAVQ